jgi:hypothetical protein
MLSGYPTITKVTEDNEHRHGKLKPGQRAYSEAGCNFGSCHPYVVASLPHHEKGPYHIICIPGHTGWCSVGNTDYYETYYAILEEAKGPGKGGWKCHVREAKFGKKWKAGIKELREQVEALMRGTTKAQEKAKRAAKALDDCDMERLNAERLQLFHEKSVLSDAVLPLANNVKALEEARREMGNAIIDTTSTLRNLREGIEKRVNRLSEITRVFELRKEK